MKRLVQCVARPGNDPLGRESAAHLNAWADDHDAECRQSLRPALVELARWLVGATGVAIAAIYWLV
jgi:DNA-binding SARP family transcriptional activator